MDFGGTDGRQLAKYRALSTCHLVTLIGSSSGRRNQDPGGPPIFLNVFLLDPGLNFAFDPVFKGAEVDWSGIRITFLDLCRLQVPALSSLGQ